MYVDKTSECLNPYFTRILTLKRYIVSMEEYINLRGGLHWVRSDTNTCMHSLSQHHAKES